LKNHLLYLFTSQLFVVRNQIQYTISIFRRNIQFHNYQIAIYNVVAYPNGAIIILKKDFSNSILVLYQKIFIGIINQNIKKEINTKEKTDD